MKTPLGMFGTVVVVIGCVYVAYSVLGGSVSGRWATAQQVHLSVVTDFALITSWTTSMTVEVPVPREGTCQTFQVPNEGHALGNSLRFMLNKKYGCYNGLAPSSDCSACC